MDVRTFRVLFDAGMRWEAQERQVDLTISAFPYMDESGQKDVRRVFARATEPAGETDPGEVQNVKALQSMRAIARFNAMTDRARKGKPSGV